ncbi:hypothetical protein F4813DRAFT_389716 [Daldinia decipiens]|uniref:uncharacterized protein n=1 Tax=Daldinia decipiens TaxID=326647 RepID=UPI0020C548E4|nr:uncharacterized protein F4813DRAFT_389716 [Daldinia decipiens]KAI1657536.1 hypothetical protein F4813DRAFT_389716 [Daldinia decipiens]
MRSPSPTKQEKETQPPKQSANTPELSMLEQDYQLWHSILVQYYGKEFRQVKQFETISCYSRSDESAPRQPPASTLSQAEQPSEFRARFDAAIARNEDALAGDALGKVYGIEDVRKKHDKNEKTPEEH